MEIIKSKNLFTKSTIRYADSTSNVGIYRGMRTIIHRLVAITLEKKKVLFPIFYDKMRQF